MPRPNCTEIVGPHPDVPHPFGLHFSALDQYSTHEVAHRSLTKKDSNQSDFLTTIKDWLRKHHASPDVLQRDREYKEALERQGLPYTRTRFPSTPNTQKGNWAEIVLAEYIVASCDATIPVYRLRYNTNIEQSMKGDDVLAFDLDCEPVRLIVGEAKFRTTPSKQVVEEIITALEKAHRASLPASLPFVTDRLFEQGNDEVGRKLMDFNMLLATDRLQIDYVGLLVSDSRASQHVQANAKSEVHRLAVITASFPDPEHLVTASFDGLNAP